MRGRADDDTCGSPRQTREALRLTDTDLIAPLREVAATDLRRVGRKAAALGELLRAGCPVPEGAVVTTAVLRGALVAAGLDEAASSAQVKTAPLPDGLAEALADVSTFRGAFAAYMAWMLHTTAAGTPNRRGRGPEAAWD